MEKKILLTFDYELFLGAKSGSVDNCLIVPTDMSLNVMERHQTKAIFFVDTTYIMRMNELANSNSNVKCDLEKIKQQLIRIVKSGHKIYHHIHPHWVDAQYNEAENQWSLSNDEHYCVETLSAEQKTRIFDFSVSFLSEIMSSAGVEFDCRGYRAGGLHIEPFASVKNEFARCGISEDFSSEAPIENMTESYRFENTTLVPATNGKFSEYPISKIRIYGLRKILNGIFFRLTKKCQKYQRIGDGVPSVPQKTSNHSVSQSKLEFTLPISIELLTPVLLPYYKKLLKRYSYIHFLSHPKLQSQKTIELFEKFLRYYQAFVSERD